MLKFGIRVVFLLSAAVSGEILVVSQNGPAVLGATVTLCAKLYNDTNLQNAARGYDAFYSQITSPCKYGFLYSDDADPRNQFLDFSRTCPSQWNVTYNPAVYSPGFYNISVVAYVSRGIRYWPILRVNTAIEVTQFLNGDIELTQNGRLLRYDYPAYLQSAITARVKLSVPDQELLSRLGATFRTDWSFDVEPPCNASCEDKPSNGGDWRLWSLVRNAHPGLSYSLTFDSFHGSYVEVRARMAAEVQNSTYYGFFYRRFLLLDPMAASGISNFTVELNRKSGHVVAGNDQVDAVFIEL